MKTGFIVDLKKNNMRDSGIKISYDSYIEDLFNNFSHPDHEKSPCQGIENVSIFVNKKRWKKRKKHHVFEYAQQPPIAFCLSRLSKHNEEGLNTKPSSMPELSKCTRAVSQRIRSGHGNDTKHNKYKKSHFPSKFIANVFSEHRFDNWFLNPNYPRQTKWKIYRCQLGAVEDSCCCSCNSDAMFEVMKGLYDCYKAKNCDRCDCVLCGYKTKEERKIGELRKSMVSAAREKVLEGKTPEEKEFILKEMAKTKQPLPSGKTPSDKALIEKTRKELGLPPSPKTASEKAKMRKAEEAGIITPLEGKTPEEKEKILQAQADMGLSLPEGRTDSEKALINKVKAKAKRPVPSALLTPLTGKTPDEKEKILRGRAMKGLPLPEPQSPSEKKLIAKVRADLGLPKEPTTKSLREKYDQAAKAGLLQPLEGKTPEEKEKTLQGLRNMGIPLPEGRTPSEKALISKVKASPKSILAPSERLRRAKAEGLITPLTGKTPEQKEKIIKGLAMKGLPLPEGTTASEKKLIDKVRADLGLPKEPTTKSLKDKFEKAAKAGLLQPLEGMTPEEKEKTLKGLHDLGIPLPEGRTPSEKALISKVKASPKSVLAPSERLRRAKAEGLITPLTGKTPEQKENIIKGLAMKGLPLPEGTTASEKKLIDKVRADLGLPKEPTTKSLKDKFEKAAKAGLLQPLEGMTPEEKEKTLKGLHDLGIPLPEGRTPSEKALISKVKASPKSVLAPSERLRRAKAEGLITPLTGKTPEQKEKIIKGLAMKGLPLPEGTTASEKKLIDKVRVDLGLPKEPTTKSLKDKFEKAAKAGLLQPLEGMTPEEKEKTLKGLHDLGIPLPEGRTPSEKAIVAKVKSARPAASIKTAGIMTPLKGKSPEQKEKVLRARAMKGIPLPEGVTPSEKKVIDKVRADLGLPVEPTTKSLRDKHEQAAKAGLLQPLEGKTPAQKEAQLKGLRDMGIPLPEGRTPSEKALIAKVKGAPRSLVAPSEQLRRAKAEGLLTPLTGKTPAQKEKILKGLAMKGLPLPEGKSPSEKILLDKVRDDLGIPKEPDTKSMKEKYDQAAKAGLLQPLIGKTPEEKEKILQGQHDLGIPLVEGRTPSEKALIAKIKARPAGSIKTAGKMTPLTGKSPEQKEKVLRARAMKGIPLPEGVTPSEKKIIDKVRADLGLPKEPTTKSLRDKHEQAAKAGLLQPLEGKTPAQKEAQLKGLRDMGIPLPEGRTPSEKALIAKVKGAPRSLVAPSEQLRRAKAEGLLTPLTGKTPAQKEKILKGLAMKGLPLPEGKSPSEKILLDKVRDDLGLPKEPDTKSMKEKYDQAAKAGLLQPLIGKTPEEKEKILQGQHDLGIPLGEGRTPSEKALIAKIKARPAASIKTAGKMTPLTGKSPEQKEKVLRARAMKGIPLPEGVTPSEKKIIDKVRADLGLPQEPTTKSLRDKHEQAAKAGLLQPLEGKTPAQKEAQLKGLRDMGIPLPEGRTPSEKALIAKVKGAPRSLVAPSEQLRRAKAEGLLTPLTGKTPAQKEKILKGLAMKGLPLPEGKSPSEKILLDKVRDDLGLPKEPDTKSMKEKYDQAAKAGLLLPLIGKTPEEKEKILQGQHDLGIPLAEGKTPSEKALIAKIKARPAASIKTAGVMTPLIGKSPEQKEKVLRARAMKGIPLPEGVTPSEKKVIDKVRADLGLPMEPTTKSLRDKHEQAAKAGLLQPLEGKTPAQKEAQLKGLRDMGIPLPEGRTPSEKALIAKVKGTPRSLVAPSEQLRRAKAEGLLTPLTGKTPAQKEKILKGLAMKGLPLPEGKSPSEKILLDKVRDDLGLPKEPDTKSMKEKYDQAAKAGLLQPLIGKTPEEKEKILQGQHDLGIPLVEGRTPSEKALIAKIKARPAGSIKTAGKMTPLTGKSPEQKEKVLRARAMKGIPLPEGVTPSEKKIIDKVRADLGLPKEPTTKSLRDKHEQAAKAGLLQPLEGKTPAQKEAQLKGLRDMGIPLPEGRTPSEKALIAKVKGAPRSLVAPSEQLRRAKAEGLLTPLTGKTPAQKEKILKGLAMKGLPLPEGKSPSEKILLDKVRDDLGIPKEPDTKSMKEKYDQAAKAGLLQPLIGKTPEEKEKILQGQHDLGIPLVEGRTPSEKALIAKIKARPAGSIKTAGKMTPLTGKSPEQKEKVLRARAMKGIPLPEGVTPSEKKIIDKVRADLGLPQEPTTKSLRDKHEQAAKAGLLQPLEGKTPAQKEAQLKGLRDMGIPLPEGRTPSEKALIAKVKGTPRSLVAPSEQLRRAKAEGLLTPLTGKTPAQKEKILKGLAMKGLPLPEGKSPSEKILLDKVRDDLGIPKEPDTKSMKEKYDQAAKAGLLQPLIGKTPEEKEKILQGQHDLGIPLVEGRTPSEKALIAKIKARPAGSIKTAGKMTPLTGKSPEQKEKVLRARAMKGIPLPEGVTPSEKKVIDKVRADLGLPVEPTTKSLRDKHEQAAKAGLLQPLEGKTPAQKEAQLKGLRDMGIPLPEGRTPSEKALIAKVKGTPRSLVAPSEQLRRAKAEGLLTPLTGKTPAQKEKILKGLAMKGLPLPEGKSPSEKILLDKVRDDLGLPKEPDTKSMKEKYDQAAKAGLLQPLIGKTPEEKEKILQGQHDLGIPLGEGRTPSEKALIAKIKARPAASIKTAGIMTPLKGKSPEQKEKVLRARAMKGIPLPEGVTPSEKKVIDKVRADLGLPAEPTTKSLRDKHEQAAKAGLLQPLEGKTPAQKEAQLKGLRDMGIPLPEGRTPSEKALIAKVKGAPRSLVAPSEQLRRAKAEGLLTPLTGKTPAQKEKILKGLAMKGLPLPEGKSPSEKILLDKVRDDLGIPKEPDTKSMKEKYDQAAKAGLLQPLIGKTPEEKEKILQGQHDLGIPLVEGRTPSEKALIAKIKARPAGSIKTAGKMTPLTGKSPEQKEKVLRARAMKGIPLPEGVTPSEKKIIDKVRADLGLPAEPTTKSLRDKHEQAAKAGLLQPLEGKTPAQKEAQLKGLRDMGIPLPEGRTPSEKALIEKVKGAPRSLVAPSEQLRRAKAEGLLTPLTGKTPAQKEKILKGLAMKGLPLPEGKSPSEKILLDKVRDDLGLPKEPDTKSMKEKYDQAAKAGLLQPLIGKTPEEKEKILQGQHDLGIPLVEGRTPSEKALIAKIKARPAGSIKTAGVMTPLKGKSPEQKEKVLRARAMKGIPLPEGVTPSEKKVIDKVRADLGLPAEPTTKSLRDKHEQAAKAGLLQPLEGKTPAQKEAQLKGLRDMGIPLPEGRTPSEKALIAKVKGAPRSLVAPSEQMRRAKAEGLLTPLTGKTPAQKEKILKGLAMKGLSLPEGKSESEKKLLDKVRDDLGLPKEPDTKSMKEKYDQAAKAGLLQPLIGKTPEEKEKILQGQHDLGIPLAEGRTPSEKALIAKIKARPVASIKTAGVMTPLKGKSPEQKEKVLRARAMKGIPLPEGVTPSEKKVIDKVRADLGLPAEPTTKSLRDKHEQAAKAGLLQPLEGKTPAQKEAQLKGLRDMGIPLPEGRTPSEKALIAKVKGAPRSLVAPSEQLRRAKAEGLLTPLTGKTPAQKEKILKGLAMKGLPLPEGKSPSEKKLLDKVRDDLGIPKEPDTKSMKEKYDQAAKAGLLQPLIGKTPEEKEKILQGQHDLGIPLAEGRTPSEKALIAKIKARPAASIKTAGIMTPLKGKSPEQKEKLLRARAMKGIPLPEGVTPSEKKVIDKVRADLGLPVEPTTKSLRDKHEQAAKAGLLQPLEGKTPAQKEAQLKGLRDMGIPLPEGRTPSEKALIAKVKGAPRSLVAPSEQLRRAKAEGLLTPLTGKTPAQKEKILKGLAMKGLPLPEGKSPSEKKLLDKVRDDLGLPKEPDTKSMKEKYDQAAKAGLLQPLIDKTPEEKEKILKGLQDLGIPLPEGRTPSEKALVAKVKAKKAESVPSITTEKINKAKADGLFTPLKGKTPEHKEKILKGLAEAGLPLPEAKTPSEKELIDKVKKDFGIPDRTPSEKLRKAQAAGLLTPLDGKTKAQKEKILRGRAAAGLPLPKHKTPSEKALIKKIKDETGYKTPSKSKRLKAAEAAGLMIPLEGKSPSMKEKILKGMKAAGVPLPEGQTPSEKKLLSKFISKPIKSVIEGLEGVPSDKVKAAKAAGLLTPLEGKTPAEKEKIIKGLAEAGLPIPEGKTKSEKSMISKIKARLPPEGKTPSEKSIIRKAKAAGLFTPIGGKAPAEKERILKGLAEAGLPLPEGKTASEKDLVKKIRAEAGLPLEATPSEKKGKIIKKGKKVGVSASKKAVGIDAEEFEDIIKTTKCDRGCGCDRKKIKFKHSYVKIRVTSPDISSFCDCPGECFPQVRSGAFIDNDGIKVTVGSAVGIPSYSMICINKQMPDAIVSNIDVSKTQTNYNNEINVLEKTAYKLGSFESGFNNNSNNVNGNFNVNSSDISYHTKPNNTQSENNFVYSGIAHYQGRHSSKDLQLLKEINKEPISDTKSASSFDTILIIRNDMSLSTSTSNSMDTISLTSVMNSSITSSSAHYSGYQSTTDLLSMNSLDEPTTSSDDFIDHPAIRERNILGNIGAAQRYTILRMSQLEDNFKSNKIQKTMKESETDDPIVLFNNLPSKLDVSKIMFKIMSKKGFAGASSIFIAVPNTEDEEEQGSNNYVDSKTSVRSSECRFTENTTSLVDPDPALRQPWFTERDEQVCSNRKTVYLQPSCNDTETMFQNESEPDLRRTGMMNDEFCIISRNNEIVEMLQKAVHGGGPDTTAERPCCSSNEHYTAKSISRKTTPFFWTDKCFSWFRCKKSTESSAIDILQSVDPSSSPVPPCRRCLDGRGQQQQKSKSPSGCSPEVLKVKRNRTAKVQKPPESTPHEGRTVTKKTGVAWLRSGLRKASASSSVPGCEIPLCSDLSSSLATSYDSHPHGRSQQQQIPASPAPIPSVKVGKSYSWFRKPRTRQEFASCNIPPSCDYRFCPATPTLSHQHMHNHNKTNPLDYSKVARNPTAKVGNRLRLLGMGKAPAKCDPGDTPPACKPRDNGLTRHPQPPAKTNRTDTVQKPSIREDCETTPKTAGVLKWLSWTRLPSQRKNSAPSIPTCNIAQYLDSSSSPVPPDYPYHLGSNQQNHTSTSAPPCDCPTGDLRVKTRTAKVQRPSIASIYHEDECVRLSWSLFPRLTRTRGTSAPSITTRHVPQYLDSSSSPVPPGSLSCHSCNKQNQTSATPSLCAHPSDNSKVKRRRSGVLKLLSWTRLPSQRKNSAPSIPTCNITQYLDSSSSPVPPHYPYHLGSNPQNHTSTSAPLCECPTGDLPGKTRTAKVQRPSIASIYHEDECVRLSWSLFPRLTRTRGTSAPSITMRHVPQYLDSSSSPVPPGSLSCHSCNKQNQTSATPSLCAHPSDNSKVKRRRSGVLKLLSWTRLPSQRKNSAPSIPTCNITQYLDSSSSPVSPHYPHHLGSSPQNHTSTSAPLCECPTGDLPGKTRTAKVQRPSIASIYHEDECVRLSWSLFPRLTSTCGTSAPSITMRHVPQYLDSSSSPVPPGSLSCHSCNQQNQTSATPWLCAHPSDDSKVKRRRSGFRSSWSLFPRLTRTRSSLSFHGCNQQNQTSATSSLCAHPSEDLKVKRRRPGKRISWSRLPRKRKTSVPSIAMCSVPLYHDSSTSPVPPDHSRHHDRNQQSQTSATHSCPDVSEGMMTRTAKVQKPSLESLYHEGQTTPIIKSVTESWSLLPSKRKTNEPSITTGGSLHCPRLHARSERTQTRESVYGYPSYDFKEVRKLSVKVQKPSIEIIRQEGGFCHENAGVVSGWFLLPSLRPASVNDTNRLQDTQNYKTGKPNTVMLSDSKPEPGGQPTGGQIFQTQNIFATKQNDPRQIWSPFRKQILMQTELAKETDKLADPIDQQPAILANEITPVQEKLTSIKMLDQKADKLMNPIEFESSKEPKSLKTKKEIKEDKPNTIHLSDSKIETGGKLAFGKISQPQRKCLFKQKDFQTICRPCPKQEQMSNSELAKENVKLPKPVDQQQEKTKELTLVQQKLTSVKTFEQKGDKPMSHNELDDPKDSKDTQTNGESKEDKQKQNIETLTDSIPEPSGQMTFEQIHQPQQGSLIKENVPREICCPFRKQNLISQPELTKEVVKLPDPQIDQQPEKLATEITPPVQQKLASSKTFEKKAEESLYKRKEDKAVSSKEINEKCFTKMSKLFVDMRKTIIPTINKILKNLKGSDNPEDPRPNKLISTKYLNSPGTSKQTEREVVSEGEDGKLKKTIKHKEKVSEKHEPIQNDATEQLPMARRKRFPPRLPPALPGMSPVETPEGYLYEGVGPSSKWLDTGVIRRLRSELTHSTSGFKASKKRKLQKSQAMGKIELDFGDAIRYFASMNPELFQQLILEELESQRKAEENKHIEEIKLAKQMKKVRKISEKIAKKGKVDKTTSIDEFPISDESDSDYPRGLKFSFVVKDGPTAIAGVDCKKMNHSRSTKYK